MKYKYYIIGSSQNSINYFTTFKLFSHSDKDIFFSFSRVNQTDTRASLSPLPLLLYLNLYAF